MTQDIHDVVKDYIIKNPTLNHTEIADLILEDSASTMAHRTLRRYVAEVRTEISSGQLLLNMDGNPTETGLSGYVDVSSNSSNGITDTYKDEEPETQIERQPKILILDIETARMIVGAWRLGKQYIGPDQIIKDWFIIGYVAKWLSNVDYMSDFVTASEALDRDDKRICSSLWKLVDEADIIITHNGNRFDLPKINTRFLAHGLMPPMPYQSIDTCKIARRQFGFSSNALNFLGKLMVNREKIETNYDLWIDVENGNQDAIDFMKGYCKGDVGLLEEVYFELRPWIKNHPNLGTLIDSKVVTCPNCGGTEFEVTGGYYTTPQNLYAAMRCKKCGAINRKSATLLTNKQRANLLIPNAR